MSGAKDLAAYGTVRWESIVDDRCGALEIDRSGRYRLSREAVPATAEIRERTGIERNGTRVTIVCRENVSRPRFEMLIDKRERCVPLREIMQNEDRVVRLVYLGDPAIRLRHLPRPHGASPALRRSRLPNPASRCPAVHGRTAGVSRSGIAGGPAADRRNRHRRGGSQSAQPQVPRRANRSQISNAEAESFA
ncbi:MAG: hypothetical protein ACYCX6_00270 [Vulcanimicrobiaceae bacterium]